MRSILIANGIASVIFLSPSDRVVLPDGCSLFSEEHWSNLIVTPGSDHEFNDTEKSYLSSIGVFWNAL